MLPSFNSLGYGSSSFCSSTVKQIEHVGSKKLSFTYLKRSCFEVTSNFPFMCACMFFSLNCTGWKKRQPFPFLNWTPKTHQFFAVTIMIRNQSLYVHVYIHSLHYLFMYEYLAANKATLVLPKQHWLQTNNHSWLQLIRYDLFARGVAPKNIHGPH